MRGTRVEAGRGCKYQATAKEAAFLELLGFKDFVGSGCKLWMTTSNLELERGESFFKF